MKRKLLLSVLLSLVLSLGLLPGCSGDGISQNPQQEPLDSEQSPHQEPLNSKQNLQQEPLDSEILKAVELGLVTQDYTAGLETQVTYAEFAAMLDAVTTAAAPDHQAAWKSISKTFRDVDQPMKRGAGAIALFDCAMALEIDGEGYDMAALWLDDEMPEGMDFWDGMPWDDPYLPNVKDPYITDAYGDSNWSWTTEYPIYHNAGWFMRRYSYGNGKCYMDYDENGSFRWDEPFTREDAIHAAERLYETAAYCYDFTPAGQAVCGVTGEALRLAQDMRPASYDSLPDWKGYTISSPSDGFGVGECGRCFYQEEVARIADMGFDFVRVPLDFQYVFGGQRSTDMIRTRFVASMDDLVNWCAARGIHVCFDIHQAPGFNTGGSDSDITIFENEEEQELFCQFWGWMAEHYQNVPSSLLSFNLMNEPHAAEEPTDKTYSALMLKAIGRIRTYTPDRLIFTDMLGAIYGRPVEGLAAAQVAQAVHPYLLAPGTQNWPTSTINGFVSRDNGVLTINGSFPAGTTITTQIDMAHAVSTLTWTADSVKMEPFPIGGEAVDEGGCIGIHEEGTDGECRSYKNKEWSVTLTEDCKRLTLRQDGDGYWYMAALIAIETPSETFYIVGNSTFVPGDGVPHLTISPDGTIQAADPATFLSVDKTNVEVMFQEYAGFTARTGEAVMIQEFGTDITVSNQAAQAFVDDLLSLADQYEIPWCSWNNEFGLWLSEKRIHQQSRFGQAVRDGADYENLGNGWIIDRGLEKIFRQHMG